jgi:hypothetical protein
MFEGSSERDDVRSAHRAYARRAVSDIGVQAPSRRATLVAQVSRLVDAVRDGDDRMVEDAVLALSRSRRIFAPLAFVVGAFVMLFQGLKLLFTNWRLTLVQLLPAMWIWIAMVDLKLHVFHGRSFHEIRGPVLVSAVVLLIAAITVASFFLNTVFAFSIATAGPPAIRPAFAQARTRMSMIVAVGGAIGLVLGVSAIVMTRVGLGWFAVSMSIAVGLLMLSYVAFPARLVGVKTTYSKRDKLAASAVSGAVGAVICTPPYVIGRVGILMLGTHWLFIPGLFLVALGATVQAGATSSVKAVKMSAKLVAGHRPN